MQQTADDHIETLAVIYLGIPDRVSLADPLDGWEGLFADWAVVVEEFLIGEGSLQVFLYLVEGWERESYLLQVGAVLHQTSVVIWDGTSFGLE